MIRDYIGVGNWVPDRPHKPAGLLGAILKWHHNLEERPAAADDAREAQAEADRRLRNARQLAERETNRRAREAAKAALNGPGHAAARRELNEALERAKSLRRTSPPSQPQRPPQ